MGALFSKASIDTETISLPDHDTVHSKSQSEEGGSTCSGASIDTETVSLPDPGKVQSKSQSDGGGSTSFGDSIDSETISLPTHDTVHSKSQSDGLVSPRYGASIDTETFGSLKDPHIVQLAMIVFDLQTGEVKSEFNTMVKPHGKFPEWPNESHYHNIKGRDAETYGMIIEEALNECVKLISDIMDDVIIIAHNIDFDRGAISRTKGYSPSALKLIGSHPWKCTLEMSRKAFPGKKNKLSEVHKRLCGPSDLEFHDALNDARASMQIYMHLSNWKPPTKNEEIQEKELMYSCPCGGRVKNNPRSIRLHNLRTKIHRKWLGFETE